MAMRFLNANRPPVVAVRDAVAAAFSDTWLFQHGQETREAAACSCALARDLLARAYIDDVELRDRLETFVTECEAVLRPG